MQLLINGEKREYPSGTTWLTVAKDYQKDYQDEILLVQVNGKLQELHKKAVECSRLEFITARDKAGRLTYRRSVTFMMLKAFYEVAGSMGIRKLTVDFSIGNGFFVEPELDFELTEKVLCQVKEKMEDYVAQKIPIMKRTIHIDEAVGLFHKYGMYDKERLFHYRRVSNVNVYHIGGFEDYFYGYMVPDTSYLKYFDLVLYQNGFVLVFPDHDPKRVDPFKPKDKLFTVLKETSDWGRRLDLADVGALNSKISRGKISQVMLIEEALMEKKRFL